MGSLPHRLSPATKPPTVTSEMEIDIQKVSAKYKKTYVLQDVVFQVRKGDIAGIIGSSGSGKTTLLRLITGQLKPATGQISVAGFDISRNKERLRYAIGYVPQNDIVSLYQEFSALGNAKLFGRLFHLPDSEIEARAREILTVLGFPNDLMKKPVRYLSGGERKRASVAVGMINNPHVLLLDEPTTGLDAHLRHDVLNFLKNLNRLYKTTMIIISHDLEIVDYCNHVMILDKGMVRQAGNPNDLVKTLPGNGAAIQLEFSIITPQVLKKLGQLPEAQFIIRRGRNAINVFTDNPADKIANYLKLLNSWELTPQQIGITLTDFTDFFLVKPWEKASEAITL